jgi:hypothetical protein
MIGLEERSKSDLMRTRLLSYLQQNNIVTTKQRVTLYFKEFIIVNGDNVAIDICESCYVLLHDHVCRKTYDNWKKEFKNRLAFDHFQTRLLDDPKQIYDIKTQRYKTIYEARESLGHLNLSDTMLQLSCIPNSESCRQAFYWLQRFFALVGDCAPNRENLVQLPGIYTKTSIYNIFKHHVETLLSGDEHTIISISQFLQIWKNVFPNVKLTRFCQVTGKCNTCHLLYERQEYFRSERDLEAIRYFANIHKILIEMERGIYIYKREQAQKFPHLYMSLIIDGMSQDHCILPYCANKVTKNVILKQKIIGAKQHGFSRTFYRLFPHVESGSNIACEVILLEIEKRMKHCLKNDLLMPNVLYLQIDGGPENTSKTFYAFIEQLVHDGVFKRIEVCRLPVGHTHEDIDALFGVLWRAAQGKTIITPQEWKDMAVATFHQDFVDDDKVCTTTSG